MLSESKDISSERLQHWEIALLLRRSNLDQLFLVAIEVDKKLNSLGADFAQVKIQLVAVAVCDRQDIAICILLVWKECCFAQRLKGQPERENISHGRKFLSKGTSERWKTMKEAKVRVGVDGAAVCIAGVFLGCISHHSVLLQLECLRG